MLHSSSGSVHFPAQHSRTHRRPLQRGHLQVSAAIKKGKEKNVVCTKQIVAKQETVRTCLMPSAYHNPKYHSCKR